MDGPFLATVYASVAEFANRSDANEALAAYAKSNELDELDSATVGGTTDQGEVVAAVVDTHLVSVRYTLSQDAPFSRQHTDDWTLTSLQDIVAIVFRRIDTVRAAREDDEVALGSAALMIGDGSDIDTSQDLYYRAMDGVVLPGLGEVEAPRVDDFAPGAIDYVASDHLFPTDSGFHSFRITLAKFASRSDAVAYADEPPSTARRTSPGEATYRSSMELDDGSVVERGRIVLAQYSDPVYRSIARIGRAVVVVEWQVSGNQRINASAVPWLLDHQVACVVASPKVCAPRLLEDLLEESNASATSAADLPAGDFVSEEYGRSVDLPDEDGLQVTDTEDDIANSDFVKLQSGRSIAMFETVIGNVDSAPKCVVAELELLQQFDEHAVIDLGSDDPSERAAGQKAGHAWAIYTVEPLENVRSDQEYTIRFDCYTLVSGDGSLVMTHIAPRDPWTAERDKGQRLQDGINLPDTRQVGEAPLVAERTKIGRTVPVINHRFWIDLAA